MIRLLQGDCRAVLATLDADSIDACVTDPPYELGFMGKGWDASGVANDVETWRQVFRVLKPGAHLLAFSGTRTYHRMVCAIEDAGFEIRDQIGWLYGSGFPKSLDVSKAIDKAAGAEREVVGERKKLQSYGANDIFGDGPDKGGIQLLTAPATDAARQWQGWGTALKPAWEPIVVARKPLIGTVAANVLAHGCGALNIDACRVDGKPRMTHADGNHQTAKHSIYGDRAEKVEEGAIGRWPANIIHDGSDEVLAAFPQSASGSGGRNPLATAQGFSGVGCGPKEIGGFTPYADAGTGSAARFFYTAKASGEDRNAGGQRVTGNDRNTHPTVKPTDLMRYLCRLVTPLGGTVLDPFAGSGSTLKAAELEGFSALGIELDPAYIETARRRIGSDAPLFAEVST